LQAEEQGYLFEDHYGEDHYGQGTDDDEDYKAYETKKKRRKKTSSAKEKHPSLGGETDDPVSSHPQENIAGVNGRRRRKDIGHVRSAARSWSEEEERTFLEGITLFGRDWKKCAEHIATRDHRAVASHAQKYLIKKLLKGEELPGQMAESGRGYTLSGKPLDPNSAAARAYGLRPEAFQRRFDLLSIVFND
jgi:protein MYSM1